jgi:hypothetical protein
VPTLTLFVPTPARSKPAAAPKTSKRRTTSRDGKALRLVRKAKTVARKLRSLARKGRRAQRKPKTPKREAKRVGPQKCRAIHARQKHLRARLSGLTARLVSLAVRGSWPCTQDPQCCAQVEKSCAQGWETSRARFDSLADGSFCVARAHRDARRRCQRVAARLETCAGGVSTPYRAENATPPKPPAARDPSSRVPSRAPARSPARCGPMG